MNDVDMQYVVGAVAALSGVPARLFRGDDLVLSRFPVKLPRDPMTLCEGEIRAIRGHVEQQITEQGEPWVSHFDPAELQASLHEMGFQAVRDFGPEELNARYLARRKDGLRTGSSFRMMCASC
jgi:O-methyltransferase involved in polyketide biosynthesis